MSRGLGVLKISFSYIVIVYRAPCTEWVHGALSPGIKRPEREADQSGPSSAEDENALKLCLRPALRHHGVMFNVAPITSSWRGTYVCTVTALPWPFNLYNDAIPIIEIRWRECRNSSYRVLRKLLLTIL
jgi:hypothetical protein